MKLRKEVESFEDILRKKNIFVKYDILLGFFFFMFSIILFFLIREIPLISIISLVMGILFFIKSTFSHNFHEEENNLQNKKEIMLRSFFLHKDISFSAKITFFIGIIFFILAIINLIFFFEEGFIAMILCDFFGAIMFIYAFKMKDYDTKISQYEIMFEKIREKRLKQKIK